MLRSPLREALRPALRPALLGVAARVETAAFSPTDLGADLLLWLDEQDGATLLDGPGGNVIGDGDPIYRWADKSGTARHADQAAGSPPNLSSGTVAFDGTDGLVAPTLGALTAIEVWLVVQVDGSGTQVLAENYHGEMSGGGYWVLYHDGSAVRAVLGAGSDDISVALSPGTKALVRLRVDVSLASGAHVLTVNGSTAMAGSNGYVGTPLLTNATSLGQRYSATLGMTGSIDEVVILAGTSTTDKATALTTYMTAKWGL